MLWNNQVKCDIICSDSKIYVNSLIDSVDLIVTSPPYANARKKSYDGVSHDGYVDWFMEFNAPLLNCLKPLGSMIINIKDSVVNGVRHRYVWHLIEKLCDNGWFSIDDYCWRKTNSMPGYWPTRLRDEWEYCFHLSKTKKPYINQEAVKQPIGDWSKKRLVNLSENDTHRQNSETGSGVGRDISKWINKDTVLPSNVLELAVEGRNRKHPAAFPIGLPLFFIKLLCPENGTVLDPFSGSGTTGIAALQLKRNCILIDNNKDYCSVATDRIAKEFLNG